mmetsp:Transcript_21769/g.33620  ORF Transcript_21769/g.33620 Transcript_21769/m.33620 type:complete len:96 (+) Transcript_21769:467-754(+)
MKYFGDVNGLMILNFSELLAVVPYLFRSLKILKMFQARDIYYREGVMPKKMIANWDERRILKIGLPILFCYALIMINLGIVLQPNYYIPNYNSLS